MQIDVHGVDAQIARADPADNGVEVGAVAIKVGPRRMGQAGDLDNVPLEQAAGIWIGDHDGGHIVRELGLQVGKVDAAIFGLGDFGDGIAHEGRRRRIRAVCRGRHQDGAPVALALGLVGGLDAQKTAELAVCAGLGRHGHRRHGRQGLQPVGQTSHQGQGALGRRNRRQGVQVAKARQARHFLVKAGIVLHGARSEGIKGQIDGVVLLAEPHIVAHGLRFREPRNADRRLPDKVAKVRSVELRRFQVNAGLVPAAQLEEQGLVLKQAASAGQGAANAGRLALGTCRAPYAVHGHWPNLS